MNKRTRATLATGIILAILVGFNAVLLRAEIGITNDPNDNVFQYALVADARAIWTDIFAGRGSVFDLIDSLNVRWNEGFALSAFYAHVPQILLSLLSLVLRIDAYTLFNYTKYALLVLLPISFFAGARLLGMSRLGALSAAFISQLVITDGLYGIDITSFVWRGWGLSSQLMALFFMPLAFGAAYRYLKSGSHFLQAVLWNVLVASAHSGIFLMLGVSYVVVFIVMIADCFFANRPVSPSSQSRNGGTRLLGLPPVETPSAQSLTRSHNQTKQPQFRYVVWSIAIRSAILFGFIGLLLAYFFIPFFLHGDYRNFSYWDPLWKFNSFGLQQVVIWFFNGDLFDFGRLPVVTLLVLFGFFYGLIHKRLVLRVLSITFAVYMVLFMGRHSPFGFVFSILPGFAEFHLHRFIVPVQFAGVYLAAELVSVIISKSHQVISRRINKGLSTVVVGIIVIITICILEKPIVNYALHNASLIQRSNDRYGKEATDFKKLVTYLKTLKPGRVYAGRPGNWGRDFKIADMPLYMALSQEGFATVGYAPQSWSPNAELDQFFDDQQQSFYTLYNVRFAVLPESIKAPDFAKRIMKIGRYHVYEFNGGGYFSSGTSSTVVYGKKTHFVNFWHWWLKSAAVVHGEYPSINYDRPRPAIGKNILKILDLTHYQDMEGNKYSLFARPPLYLGSADAIRPKKISENIDGKAYQARFTVPDNCFNCVIILKNTYHPNWQVRVNGKSTETFPLFPFYIGINADSAGEYIITAEYKPGMLK